MRFKMVVSSALTATTARPSRDSMQIFAAPPIFTLLLLSVHSLLVAKKSG